MTFQITNACIDGFQKSMIRKYEPAGNVADVSALPSKFSLRNTPIFDQGDLRITRNACTIYGETRTKHDQESKVSLDPVEEWKDALLRGAREDFGWSLQEAIAMFLDKKYIKGYGYVDHVVQEMKNALRALNPIYTGTNKCSRTKTFAHGKKLFQYKADGVGHAFEISGRDDNYLGTNKGAFECTNSDKENPEFWISYEDIAHLFTCIVLILDQDRVVKQKMLEDQKTLQEMIDKGITNGNDLDSPLPRGQFAVMVGRAMYGNDTDEVLMERTKNDMIRNGTDLYRPIVRNEMMIMLGRFLLPSIEKRLLLKDHHTIEFLIRMGVTNGDDQSGNATRRQGVLMLGRAMRLKSQK